MVCLLTFSDVSEAPSVKPELTPESTPTKKPVEAIQN
jgi:hypothetical protein